MSATGQRPLPLRSQRPEALFPVAVFLYLLVIGTGCMSPLEKARVAEEEGRHQDAAVLLLEAAADAHCPERASLLLERAQLQDLSSSLARSGEAVHRAVTACPDYSPARWALAQLLLEQGQTGPALDEARLVAQEYEEAAALVARIEAEERAKANLRRTDKSLVLALRKALDLEVPDQVLDDASPARLRRRVPIPMTLDYAVHLDAAAPKNFSMEWKERLRYQGDPAAETYRLIRVIEAPNIDRNLPVYFRLEMANQKLPMRFVIDRRGDVVEALWHEEGPDRGMRPEMLKPAIEGALTRTRVFDPGESGLRSPGDRWGGETIRIVDGKPIPVEYRSEAKGWRKTLGIRTLLIRTEMEGEGYLGSEEVWLHPGTAVEVRWKRHHSYGVEAKRVVDRWDEVREGALVAVGGVE